MMKISGWLWILFAGGYAIAALVGIILWHPVLGSVGLSLIALAAWIFWRECGRKERELSRQGYHVEWISPGLLRDGSDDIAIVYYDNRGEIWFSGKLVGRDSIITIPDPQAWAAKVPDWARDQREIIIDRIRKAHRYVIIH